MMINNFDIYANTCGRIFLVFFYNYDYVGSANDNTRKGVYMRSSTCAGPDGVDAFIEECFNAADNINEWTFLDDFEKLVSMSVRYEFTLRCSFDNHASVNRSSEDFDSIISINRTYDISCVYRNHPLLHVSGGAYCTSYDAKHFFLGADSSPIKPSNFIGELLRLVSRLGKIPDVAKSTIEEYSRFYSCNINNITLINHSEKNASPYAFSGANKRIGYDLYNITANTHTGYRSSMTKHLPSNVYSYISRNVFNHEIDMADPDVNSAFPRFDIERRREPNGPMITYKIGVHNFFSELDSSSITLRWYSANDNKKCCMYALERAVRSMMPIYLEEKS